MPGWVTTLGMISASPSATDTGMIQPASVSW